MMAVIFPCLTVAYRCRFFLLHEASPSSETLLLLLLNFVGVPKNPENFEKLSFFMIYS